MVRVADEETAPEERRLAQHALPIFRTLDGRLVINRPFNHVSRRALYWLPKALEKVDTRGRKDVREEVQLWADYDYSAVVRTHAGDEIFYAQRTGRNGYRRFVRNRKPEPTDRFTVILHQHDGDPRWYIIKTAWIGPLSEPEPDDYTIPNEHGRRGQRMRLAFWLNHAFVADLTEFKPGTVTGEIPLGWRKRYHAFGVALPGIDTSKEPDTRYATSATAAGVEVTDAAVPTAGVYQYVSAVRPIFPSGH